MPHRESNAYCSIQTQPQTRPESLRHAHIITPHRSHTQNSQACQKIRLHKALEINHTSDVPHLVVPVVFVDVGKFPILFQNCRIGIAIHINQHTSTIIVNVADKKSYGNVQAEALRWYDYLVLGLKRSTPFATKIEKRTGHAQTKDRPSSSSTMPLTFLRMTWGNDGTCGTQSPIMLRSKNN